MRKYLPYLFLFILVSVAASLYIFRTPPAKFHTVTVPGKISISVPDYLSSATDIDTTALLQFRNEKKQLFLLLKEKKDTTGITLDSCFKKYTRRLISYLDRGNLTRYYPQKINGKDALIGHIVGSTNDSGVYYEVAVIRSGNTWYKLIIGSSNSNRTNYTDDFEQILLSIKVY